MGTRKRSSPGSNPRPRDTSKNRLAHFSSCGAVHGLGSRGGRGGLERGYWHPIRPRYWANPSVGSMSAAVVLDSYAENRRLSLEMARAWGRIVREELPSGNVRFRVDLGVIAVNGVKKRRRISTTPSPHFLPFTSERDAEVELERIRARAIGEESKASIVASYLPAEVSKQQFETWLWLYVEHFKAEVETGDLSYNSLREIQRWAAPGGYWRWWDGKDIRSLTNADGTAYTRWLAGQPSRSNKAKPGDLIGAKTRRNVIHGLRSLFTWASTEAATGAGKAWEVPLMKVPPYVRPQTPTISPDATAAVLADIPWEARGIFLAAVWEVRRFSTLAAATLDDYDPETRRIHWHQGRQGAQVDAPIRGQKNRVDRWREVFAPELIEWLDWRFAQVSLEDRMAGRATALFWYPKARNKAKSWSYDSYWKLWTETAEKHGVTVSPGAGTRTSSLSAFAEVLPLPALQNHSDHASTASLTRHYTHGAKPAHAAMVKRLRPEGD